MPDAKSTPELAPALLAALEEVRGELRALRKRVDLLEGRGSGAPSRNKESKAERHARRWERRRARQLPEMEAWTRALDARPQPTDPDDLSGYAFRMLSQHAEDGVVYEILRRLGMPFRTCVELGCGANGGNSGILPAFLGYRALMVDGNPDLTEIVQGLFAGRDVTVMNAWIALESVNDLLSAQGFGGQIDYLGLDLDGNDFWIWEAITASDPLLFVAEYNPMLGPTLSATIPYDPTFDRHQSKKLGYPVGYYGASLAAFTKLSRRKGYRLVATVENNAFFLKEDQRPELRTVTPEDGWRMRTKGQAAADYEAIHRQDPLQYFADSGWPLVEI